MFEIYSILAEQALRDEAPTIDQALWILDGDDVDLLPLLQAAYAPRKRNFGRKVMVHILNNLQNGLCPEDCGYCSQNRDSEAEIRPYTMKSDTDILAEAERVARAGASRYCMVLSGRGPSVERTRQLAKLVRQVKDRYPIEVCLSVGIMGEEQARLLAEAGLDRLNHNLNTSAEHYPSICSTHTYEDRVATLSAAKKHGIETCSGLIVGMGETSADIAEVAFELRRLEVPSIPVNFLIPIAGNQMQSDGSLTPQRCLRALCLMRLVNPRAEIRVAAGREGHLRSLEAMALYPANSLFIEGYLTTRGHGLRETYEMIRDAGFEVEGNPLHELTEQDQDQDQQPLGIGEQETRERFRILGSDQPLLRPEVTRS